MDYVRKYVFSSEEIVSILINYIRKVDGLSQSESLDVSVEWNIREPAEENNITLTIKPTQEGNE